MEEGARVVVIGSGFGGSVAALRLTEKGYRVTVIEAGSRFEPHDFPRRNWNLRRYLFAPRLGLRGIQRLTFLDDLVVLSGAGVGGGSLVYANTLYEPLAPFYDDPQWASIADWRIELAEHFDTARAMLGASVTPFDSPAEPVVREVARRMGGEATFERTTVAVDFDRCVRCGGCMIGCRYGAKNTLDRNYLRLAVESGAVIHADRTATRIRREGGGWLVETERSGAWARRERLSFEAAHVVLAAGVLGTVALLQRSGLGGPNVGKRVRSNSEVIVGSGARTAAVDYSEGIAIGSSFHANPHTRIEPVRYPRGSSLMGLFSTVLVDGGPGRRGRWLRTLLRDPVSAARAHLPWRFAERTVILLVMQARDNALALRWNGRRLRSEPAGDAPPPTWIPEANEAARHAADVMGGVPGSALNEVLLDRPFTAHILGGAVIGATPDEGVVDAWHRVFSDPGLHVVDGAAISANLGTNPSLTIAAQAERAMAFWPRSGEQDERPPLGARYAAVRRSGRSESTREQSAHTVRSSS